MTPKPQPQAPKRRNEPGTDSAPPPGAADQAVPGSGNGGGADSRDEAFAKLRHILLAPEQQRIDALGMRLDNLDIRADELARVLPKAIVRATQQETGIETAMEPILQKVLQATVKRNPQNLVDALFPVMGPAIRKAVAASVRTMVESLNRMLEQSFTWQGIQWRIEAARTGKSIGEVVLAHSLVYSVRQVILIHKETGLLLQAVGIDEGSKDQDLLSAMLTAIQQFAKNSLDVGESEELESLEVGDLSVWIERGPDAILAAVIYGNTPRGVRVSLQDALGDVHGEMTDELANFDGDSRPFELARPLLEPCLSEEYVHKEKKKSPVLYLIYATVLVLLGTWGFFSYQARARWWGFLELARAEPGIVVVSSGTRDGKFQASLLRDPLAADPVSLMRQAEVDLEDAAYDSEPFLSFDPQIVTTRAAARLKSPASLAFQFEQGVLTASGAAPRAWIVKARAEALHVPGVSDYREDGLTDLDLQALLERKKAVEGEAVQFVVDTTRPEEGQEREVKVLAATLDEFIDDAAALGFQTGIQVVGRTDSSGDESRNVRLSRQRAELVAAGLVSSGLPAAMIEAAGVGSSQPVAAEDDDAGRSRNRSVSVELSLTETAGKPGSDR